MAQHLSLTRGQRFYDGFRVHPIEYIEVGIDRTFCVVVIRELDPEDMSAMHTIWSSMLGDL